ncbi:MAG: hypothetical protein AAGA69_10750, partial [Pseudomonadota bacterium]
YIFLFVLPISIIHSLVSLIQHRLRGKAFVPTLGAGLLALGIFMGDNLDKRLEAASKDVGDEILELSEQYRAQTGRCPAKIDELYTESLDIPAPPIKGSKFSLGMTTSGHCRVIFASTNFISCSKWSTEEDWYCD